jgi:hypothetical protein
MPSWFNPFSSNVTLSNSVRSRPPPYELVSTPVPVYPTSEPSSASAHDPDEIWQWSEALATASSPDSATDILSISGTSAEGTSPAGPRYSELEPYRCPYLV